MSLSGKVAMVTGTSANIGGGIAEELAAAGSALVCVDSREENAADCARYIKSTGGRATALTCDVTDERQVVASVAAVFTLDAVAQAKPEVLVKQRQAAMTLQGKYFGPLGGMAQAEPRPAA